MKKLLYFVIAAAVIGGAVGYFMWNKPHENIAASKADVQISAADLFGQFSSDEATANAQYLDKTVEVSGIVKSSGNNKITLNAGADAMFGVVCELDNLTQHAKTAFAAGEQVTLKGKCSGFNMDVQLNRCVVVK